MTEGCDKLGIVGTYASTEQERGIAVVGMEETPVEFLAIAAHGLALCVEQEIVDDALIGLGLPDVFWAGNIK